MKQRYEYKFVRVGEGWFGSKRKAEREYQQIVQDHARDGWRLVQVFAPSTGAYGAIQGVQTRKPEASQGLGVSVLRAH